MHLNVFPFESLLVGRHGRSWANLASARAALGDHSLIDKFRHQHTSVMELDPEGEVQAKRKGVFLKRHGLVPCTFHACSKYRRAIATAQHMNVAQLWQEDARLNERDWGPMDQISSAERTRLWPSWKTDKEADPHEWRPILGESIREVRLRVLQLLHELGQQFPKERGCIVAHGETNLAIQACIERLTPEEFNLVEARMRMDNATLVHYHSDGNGRLWKRTIDPHTETVTDWSEVPLAR
ncbi:MAG: histidine phosphatase family protein [Candidatus Pacebacteria bacterium]|nr:histidine phosphatase family protein [Candidatus Paceibacterota bacterium]